MPTRPKNTLLAYPHLDGDALPTIAEMERELITAALAFTHGSVQEAAKILGIDRKTIYRKGKRYGWEWHLGQVVEGYQSQPVKIRGRG